MLYVYNLGMLLSFIIGTIIFVFYFVFIDMLAGGRDTPHPLLPHLNKGKGTMKKKSPCNVPKIIVYPQFLHGGPFC